MSVVAVAVILGVLVVMATRAGQVRAGAAVLCILFGLVLGATPAGPAVNEFLTSIGQGIWETLQAW
ncbi:hypothetical protein [Cellulomonas fimi]|uniref:Uncharacterized protein n=1 Tax=Cellulomonas fimi TaxID=1708 RepID=A0A7Y0LYA9_CELFI|nr:hypothetical protein [Cellulomonas fimi]NMR20472.1 hypothetical protein [Cellulomonas fimi]